MKRRILAALLTVCMLLTMAPTVVGATDGATISAGDVSVTAGSSVTVTIRADNFENIASLDLYLYYDSSVMSVSSCTNGTMLSGCTSSTNTGTPGEITLSAISLDGINGSGTLLTVRFYVNSACPAGVYPVTVVVGDAYDANLQPAPISAVSGKITVSERTVAATTFSTSCSVNKTGLYLGDTVTITINGSTSRPFVAANFTFDYDPEVFELQSVSLSSNLTKSDAVYSVNDTLAGQVKISYAAVTPVSSYALYTVTLKVIADVNGTSKVSATASDVYKENLEAYASGTAACTFTLYQKAQPVDYPDIFLTTQQMVVGRECGSVLKLQAGAGVAAADFTLTYDPGVLRCVSVSVADQVGQTGGMIVLNDNYYEGTIRFSYINMNGYSGADIELISIVWEPIYSPENHRIVTISGSGVVDANFNAVQLEYVADSGCIYDPIVTPPGCMHDGYTTYYCVACGDNYVSDHLDALGHGFVDGYCTRCGACEDPVAEGTCGDGLFWNLTEDGKLILLGMGRMYDYSETNLPPWYDYSDEIQAISIGGAVTYIGSMAFYGCQQIGRVVFEGSAPGFHANAFYSVTATVWYPAGNATWTQDALQNYGGTVTWLPYGSCGDDLRWELGADGVLTISGSGEMYDYTAQDQAPWHAFNSSITKVVIGEGITSVGNYAFYNCGYIYTVVLPDSLTAIGDYAFNSCWNLNSMYLPDGLTELGYGSLGNIWGLSIVVVPAGVADVSGVFTGLESLQTVIFRGDAPVFSDDTFLYDYTTVYYPAYNDTWTEAVRQNYGGTITWVPYEENYWCDDLSWTFADGILTISGHGAMIDYCYNDTPWYGLREQITGVVVEEGITRLCRYAFHNCTALTDVSLPNSLKSLGNMSFYNCTALTSIDLPDSITDMGTYTFYSCKALTDVHLPAGITAIGYGTFNNCVSLKQIEIPASVMEIGNNAFSNCSSLTSITIPDTVTTLGTYLFSGCSSLTQVEFPSGITTISYGMFANCSGLQKIALPETVTSIGSYAFSGCSELTEIDLPDGVNSLGNGAFQNCTGLTGLVIPEGVTAIPNNTFYGCASLTAMDIPGNVTSIGNYAFYNCSGLREVSFHPGLQTIGDRAFQGCTQLKQVVLPEGLISIGRYSFKTCSSMTVLELPDTLTTIGDETFHGCSSLKEVVIPRSMTAIGNYMFSQCFGLERIEIPDTVTSIGKSAFHTCRSLTSIVIPESVNSVGPYVFSNCTGLKEIAICNPDMPLTNWSLPTSAVILCNEGSQALSYAKTNGRGYCAAPTGVIPGHYCEGWTVTKQATCTQTGIKTGACAYCQRTVTESIPVTDHSYASVVTPPTCTEDGYTTHTCAGCGGSYADSYVEVLGHSFGDWYIVTSATCTEDGAERHDCVRCAHFETRVLEATDHNLTHHAAKAATCTEYGWEAYETCSKCDYTTYQQIEALGHSYGAWYTTTEATCTENGEKRHDCANCDHYETAVIEATGHNYNAVVTAPTCTEQGYTTHTCANCGDTYVDSYVDALGHDYGDWYVVTEATCTENGEERHDCANCDHYETRVVEATGHDYKAVVTAPTCTEQGYTTHTCANCGDEYVDSYVEALGHSYGDWYIVTEATCTTDGEERHDCANCDHYETAVIEATGHNYNAVVTAPTCTEQGYTTHTCANCGDEYVDSYVEALGHSYGDWYIVTEATCTTDGEERHDCANCNHYETRVIEAIGHNYNAVVTAPTCTEQGYTTHTCANCGDSYVDSEVDATGHSYGEWYTVIDATCTENGEKRHDCENCDHYEAAVIEAIGHDYKAVVTAPTCTEQGYTTHTCAGCGDSYVDSQVDALGHSYGEWYVVTDATCTEDGEQRHDCANCDHYETRVVEAIGHSYDAVVTAPTCTEQGYTTHTCANCGDVYVDSQVDATGHSYGEWYVTEDAFCTEDGEKRHDCENCDHYETAVIEATGHSYDAVVTAPTCTEQGYTTHTCANCGDVYVDSQVDATGHSYGEWYVVTDATCTENGEKRHDCENCDHYEIAVIEAIGHNYNAVVTAPTCTEQGYTTHTCANCGDSYVDSYVDALSHSYGEWYTVIDATCTENGEKRHDCENCDHYETAVIEEIGHNYESVVTEPTDTEKGYTTHTCTNCGHEYVDSYVDALGLLGDANGDGKINTTDAKLIMQYELGMIDGTTLNIEVLDVNGDGKINTTDAKLVMQFELGMIDELGTSPKEISAEDSDATVSRVVKLENQRTVCPVMSVIRTRCLA